MKHRLADTACGPVQDTREVMAHVEGCSRMLVEEKQAQIKTGKELDLLQNFPNNFRRQTFIVCKGVTLVRVILEKDSPRG